MPGYKAHIGGGIIIGGGCLAAANWFKVFQPEPETAIVLMVAALLGALFPDTDTDSRGQKLFYVSLVILDLVLMIQGRYKWAAILGFCAMLPAIGHHRGWTHTWWAMLTIPLPIILLPAIFYGTDPERLLPFYLAAVVGYFSHLLLDRKF
jgi:membrane-bound metal-dependent hydrolase YbcI (DUF457 family)